MNSTRMMIGIVAALALANVAWATHPTAPPPVDPAMQQGQGQNAYGGRSNAGAAAGAVAGAAQQQGQSMGQGQASTNTNTVAGGTASTTGMQSINDSSSYNYPRQTPPVMLPAILVNKCGAGVNAGGSDEGGAGAFGITWTTDKCYAFMSGSNWIALGEYEAACIVWKDVNRKAFARQKFNPDCKVIAERLTKEAQRAVHEEVIVEKSSDPGYATKDYVDEHLDRAFRKSVGK